MKKTKTRSTLRAPWLWAVLLLFVVYLVSRSLMATSPSKIDTSAGLELLGQGKVVSVKVVDGEQRVEMELSQAYKDKGKLVEFFYVEPQGPVVVQAIKEANPKNGFNSEVPSQSWWSSLLLTMVP
ncbi:MAG: ATP-dependent metallopeptidase FtsH/Yme1/Tma family protein, partial [Micrococcales bacterium]|nr:ATP-dependent metallopeptidase FtsH/Yme1/Tma family protein [Micrococcales bacterium]